MRVKNCRSFTQLLHDMTGTGLSHAPELWTRFLVQPNSLEGFWKKNSTFFERSRKGRYVSRKISPGRINCLGRLLLTTQTPEKILPIWPALLDFCWLGAPAYCFESNLASSWAPPVVTLKFRSWFSPVLKSKIDMLFLRSHASRSSFWSTQAHHFVSISSSVKKTIETFLEAVLPRKAPNKRSMPWWPDRNILLSKKGKRDGSGFGFSRSAMYGNFLLVAGQSAASITWKPLRDMGECLFHGKLPMTIRQKTKPCH